MKQGMHIHNLSFAFSSKANNFFNDVNFTIDAKKIYFLLGANGSGKSTLFRLLQGNLHEGEVVSGTVSIDGIVHDLASPASRQMLHTLVHAVQQDYAGMIADQFNFEENLRFALLPRYPLLKSLPAYKALPALIERFNIDIHKPARLLSGGQRQILTILMALQKPTALLLLDEPTAAMDPVNTAMVFKFLHELVLATDITVFIISHDQTVLQEYAKDAQITISVNQQTGERIVA